MARFNPNGRKVTVIQCYAPANAAETEEKEAFYEQLQEVVDKLPRRDLKIPMGDLNAKVGADNTNRELVMGKHGVGVQNENGERLTIGRKWRGSLLDVRVRREADAASDHHLVVADLNVKLKVYRDRAEGPSH